MEPVTHDGIWRNFIEFRPRIKRAIANHFQLTTPNAALLENDDSYAAIMARMAYLRAPGSLPPAGNLQAQAGYWKQYYNTPLARERHCTMVHRRVAQVHGALIHSINLINPN